MPKITYIQPDGTAETVEAETGSTVMETAIDNDIDGIVAECGGACSCATCHVYVDEAWIGRLDPPDAQEDGMLDCVLDRQATSRLSCQIEVTEEIDGLVVRVPEAQL
jgi:2Fe-2S ferredoxin